MVSFRLFLATLASNALLAASAPTLALRGLASRAPMVQIEFCEKTYWAGECEIVSVEEARCTSVPEGWNDRISSIRNVDRDDFKCTWYLDGDCEGQSYDNQEDADLGDGNGRFDESISSYICVSK
ncbi:hypothetical protein QBC34DRAFT_338268 [Podospora aff. communis PSN243]|uniref:Beta/gamma crystallin 'Greek key' domain-containing protein n=1 Tax=Podospora aff. communis PSN243 TaxID=3040156 RepID=A0AAV9G0Q1_9PEZI|nr:hypothetical protein QBC34DRAFT_338268 [Podospora aff. communis PSN243]